MFANRRVKVYSTIGEYYFERENENMKRLPDSELEIMMIIWEFDRPVTRFEIEAEMGREIVHAWEEEDVQNLFSGKDFVTKILFQVL